METEKAIGYMKNGNFEGFFETIEKCKVDLDKCLEEACKIQYLRAINALLDSGAKKYNFILKYGLQFQNMEMIGVALKYINFNEEDERIYLY